MKIYFDTEFTGLHKNTTLISIGMVAENGRTFYAEFTDYDKNQVDQWIKDNVINNLTKSIGELYRMADETVFGSKKEVKSSLINWLSSFKEPIQFISDVCHYDFVLLVDIFGTAFDLPEFICPSCHDINQDIAKHNNISEYEAFNLSREEIAEYKGNDKKHNALFDAKIIKAIAEKYNF